MNQLLQSTLQQDLTTSQYWDRQWTTPGIVNRQDPVKRIKKRTRTQPFLELMSQMLNRQFGDMAEVLEVGCAPGYLMAEFAGLRPKDRLHGVDFATDGFDFTRQLLDELNIKATLHLADVRNFIPEEFYDLVYSCGLIEHFTEPKSIMEHHVRLCKPGGIVAVSIPNYGGKLQEWLIHRLDPEALEAHNLALMNAETLKQLMLEVGLKGVLVGGVGTSTLRSKAQGTGLSKIFLRRVAQTWNLTNQLLPKISSRHGNLWAMGQVPLV